MSTAREAILDRIRSVNAANGVAPVGVAAIPRDYRRASAASAEARLEQLIDRLVDYKAKVRETDRGGLAAELARACADRSAKALVVPADWPDEWAPAGVECLRDRGLTDDQLEGSDGVLTGCALAIAETGTIVLDGGERQGRRVISLLPDYHLCVVFEDQVVGSVPEGVAALRGSVGKPERPQTWISGPSATSDIELNRVEGVHGPRTLEVVIVKG